MTAAFSHAALGSLLRNRAERLQSMRSAMRVLTFGLTASFVLLHAQGPEVLLILVPEIIAFVLYFRLRRLGLASRRARAALLFEDGLGASVDRDLLVDLQNDIPGILAEVKSSNQAAYYTSQSPTGVARLMENLHESVFFWSALINAQRRSTAVLAFAGALALIAVLGSIYVPNVAPAMLSAAGLIVAIFFVSEQVNEIGDLALHHREFERLEKELAAAREGSKIGLAEVLTFVARYAGLANTAPLVPAKLFGAMNAEVARRWLERNRSNGTPLELSR